MTLLLVGCAGGDGGRTPRAGGESSTVLSSAQGKTMGIDTVDWPQDVEGARALFKRMPEQLAGMRLRRPQFYGNSTGVEYHTGGKSASAWVMGTDKSVKDPKTALSVMFGLGLACEKGTYAGTAIPMTGGYGPGIPTGDAPTPAEGLWWFSCTVDAAEGDPEFTGQAVGWVSGDIAWLTVSTDERIAQSLIEALIKARFN